MHCYATGGVYNVCMTSCCIDADGNIIGSNTICHEITLDCCTLPFEWFSNATDCTVCFAPIFEGPNPTDCIVWDFGDGTYGYGVNPCHTYPASGVYSVCMYAWCCNDVDVPFDPTTTTGVIDLIQYLNATGTGDVICHDVQVNCCCCPDSVSVIFSCLSEVKKPKMNPSPAPATNSLIATTKLLPLLLFFFRGS